MAGVKLVRAIAFAAGSVGGLSGAAYGLLNGQGKRAKSIITGHVHLPLNADGVYCPDGCGPLIELDRSTLSFAMLGDSLAAGVGAESAERLPGVLLAKGLAEESGRPVLLSTHAISGSKTHDLADQVDRALINPPDLALIIIGGNDVTTRSRISTSAMLLAHEVVRLCKAGTTVVVATCPDLGTVYPIPQPLRELARRFSLTLARAQRRAMDALGVLTVPLADLVSPEFVLRPDVMFSPDRFHPSGAGYEFASRLLLHALCEAGGLVRQTDLPMAA